MGFLNERKCYKALEPAKEYKVKLRSYEEHEAKEENSKPYVVFKFELNEDGRTITDTRMYPQGTDIIANQIAEQFGFNAIGQDTMFDSLIAEDKDISMWVEKVVVDTRFYTNYLFRKPLDLASSTSATAKPNMTVAVVDEKMPF